MWWSDEQWEELCDPSRCKMCDDAHLAENAHSVMVASTATSFVRLSRNQAHAGYTLVILRAHVTALEHLDGDQLSAFWKDVQRAGRAVETVYSPRKIAYLVMGHRMPHLHCHVFPQHVADDPKRNVDISDGPVLLSPVGLHDAAQALRSAWAAVR
ncbi:HIT family protein [Microbacterium oxydans]|uniref:HIT family protein n=1 Tax=Microbacterium oxydans TaxID=82380 RepID=UPI0022B0F61B|nr:HIT family protein [Microbacterium oxydans]MCZ4301068.1 HIT family protein [Microbacterium oxydans]